MLHVCWHDRVPPCVDSTVEHLEIQALSLPEARDRRFLGNICTELHSIISQKTIILIPTARGTSNVTYYLRVHQLLNHFC